MQQTVWTLNEISLGRTGSRLRDVSLEIGTGRTALLGCSGAGKSSLLGLLAGFEQPASGAIAFDPHPAADQIPIFWSPQDLGLWPHLTATEHITHVRPESPIVDRSDSEWLELAGLAELAAARPDRMSQGERSRLSVVRTLASEAWALLFDEPFVHIDAGHSTGYWNLILEVTAQLGGPLVYSTHDPDSVLRFAEHVVCLDSGRVLFSGPVNQLYFDPPDQDAAGLLGPYNWFGNDDQSIPTHVRADWPTCVRPFELKVTEDTQGMLRVAGAQTIGGLHELTLVSPQTPAGDSFSVSTTFPQQPPQIASLVRLDFHPAAARQHTAGD